MSGTNRRNIWATARESGVENFTIDRLGTIGVQAEPTVTRYTIITAGVQNSDTHKTKFAVLGTLPSGVSARKVRFIVAVGGRNDICRCDGAAVLAWGIAI